MEKEINGLITFTSTELLNFNLKIIHKESLLNSLYGSMKESGLSLVYSYKGKVEDVDNFKNMLNGII